MSGIGDNSGNKQTILDVEPLKTSVASCMRAIAQDGELEVTYGREKPGISGQRVRLPDPGKNRAGILSRRQVFGVNATVVHRPPKRHGI